MRKFKLLKDTPTIKAGTIFQEVTSDYDKSRELVRIMPTSGTTSPQWTIDDINNFDEWFEEVKEFEEWKPEHGEKYKVISNDGSVSLYCREDDNIDRFNFSIGNCYPTDTPDEVIIKEQKLIPQAMHRLKMASKKAWFEFNGSKDWDMEFDAYYIASDLDDGSVRVRISDDVRSVGDVYFPTKESCQAYIDKNNDDLKLLFGVE